MTTRIAQILERWDAIGEHRTGTDGDRRTADWLIAELQALGLHADRQGFPFRRRSVREAWVELDDVRIDGLPCFDGGATAAPLEARLRPIAATGSHIDGEPSAEAGAIGVGTFSPAALDPATRALAAARGAHAHAALIAIASGQDVRPGLAVVNAEAYAEPSPLPVLQVATEHRQRLQEAAAAGRTARLQISFDEALTEAFNVLARVPGRDPGLAPVVVMTPRSSWWTSTAERGGGIVVWLEAARMLAQRPPLRTVILAANTGHELGHLGFEAWLGTAPGLLTTAHVWVHLGANFAARDGQVRYQASNTGLLALGLEALAAEGVEPEAITPVGSRPLGEARNVFDGNGRYVSLLGSNPLFHHPDDRWPEAVDLAKTAALTQAMLALVERLANEPEAAG